MAESGFSSFMLLVWLAIVVVNIVGWWRLFTKAGQPGWGSLIPIYNAYLILKIGGNPWWYLLLLLVPILNFLVAIKASLDVASAFGKGIGYGLGMFFLSFIFVPLLAFGDATYRGGADAEGGAVA